MWTNEHISLNSRYMNVREYVIVFTTYLEIDMLELEIDCETIHDSFWIKDIHSSNISNVRDSMWKGELSEYSYYSNNLLVHISWIQDSLWCYSHVIENDYQFGYKNTWSPFWFSSIISREISIHIIYRLYELFYENDYQSHLRHYFSGNCQNIQNIQTVGVQPVPKIFLLQQGTISLPTTCTSHCPLTPILFLSIMNIS